jgi:hypothetical protein
MVVCVLRICAAAGDQRRKNLARGSQETFQSTEITTSFGDFLSTCAL